MATDRAQQEREMDALVKGLYGLVPETPVKTAMQELRQKVADALARAQTASPAIGMSYKGQLMMGGVQAGSAAMLEMVLDWIDETEGKDEHRRDASGP